MHQWIQLWEVTSLQKLSDKWENQKNGLFLVKTLSESGWN